MKRIVLVVFAMILSITGFGQTSCPFIPAVADWDTVCFNTSNDPLLLPQAFFAGKYNSGGMSALIPENRPTWALSIAHAALLEQGLSGSDVYPRMSFWMATVTQESQWRCDDVYPGGATWNGGLQYSPTGELVPTVGDDGCFQIEGINNGSAYGALLQYYPLRFRQNEHPNLIGGANFETSALTKVYYDKFTSSIAEYRWDWDYTNTVENACDPYAYEKLAASAYNAGIYGFLNAEVFMGNTTDCRWVGLPATTAGYASQVGDMMAVLEQNTTYGVTTFDAAGSAFLGYYSEDISWSVMLDYFEAIDDLYYEIDFAGYVIPRVQSKWEQVSGSIVNDINFQDLRPIINEIIFSLPREDALAPALLIDGAPDGPNGVRCSGEIVPYVNVIPKGNTEYCQGLTLEIEANVQGGGGASPTYQWYKDGILIPTATSKVFIVSELAGSYGYSVEVCNGANCNFSECELDVTVTDCGGCGMFVGTSSTNTECKGMSVGTINFFITGNTSNDYTINYEGSTSIGDVSGSIQSSLPTGIIRDLPDGSYNITVIDNSDNTCKAFSNVNIDFNTLVNEFVQASIVSVNNCIADIDAEIIELPAPCQFLVQVGRVAPGSPTPNDTIQSVGWEQWFNAIAQPSSGGALSFQLNVFNESFDWDEFTLDQKADYARQYMTLNTGDTVNFYGQALTGVPGATQASVYRYEVFDENNNSVFRSYSIPGTSSAGDTIALGFVGTFRATCPYNPPAYDFTWEPNVTLKRPNTEILSEAQVPIDASTDVQYVVTATNKSNSACVYKDSIIVPFDPLCDVLCYDPENVILSNGGDDLTGIVKVCSDALAGSGYPITVITSGIGNFEYELFIGGVSQGTTTNSVFSITVPGDYYVEVRDRDNPGETSCHQVSETISIQLDTINITEYCIGDPVNLGFDDGNAWNWFEADGTTLIGSQDAGGEVLWGNAPQVVGNTDVVLDLISPVFGEIGGLNSTQYSPTGSQMSFTVLESIELESFEVACFRSTGSCPAIGQFFNSNLVISGPSSVNMPVQVVSSSGTPSEANRVNVNVTLLPGVYTMEIPGIDLLLGNRSGNSLSSYVTISGSGAVPYSKMNFKTSGTLVNNTDCFPATFTIEAKTCCVEPVISKQPIDRTICAGDDQTFDVVSSTSDATYQWQVSLDNGLNWTDLSNGPNYTGVNLTQLTVFNSTVVSPNRLFRASVTTAAGCSLSSNEASLTVNETPITPVIEGVNAYCQGSTIALNVTSASETPGATYEWRLNGTVVGGDTQDFTQANAEAIHEGNYTLITTLNTCESAVSANYPVTLTASPTIAVGIAPVQCGDAVDLDTLFTESAGIITYYTDAGATTILTDPVTTTGTYYARTDDAGCLSSVASIFVTINEIPIATLTSGSAEICDDGSEEATLNLSVSGGSPDYTVFLSNGDNVVLNSGVGTHPVNQARGYSIVGVSDANCSNSVSNTGTFTVTNRTNMDITNVKATCNGSSQVIITFDITGGDNTNYIITGITGGGFAAGTYTSDPLAENVNHTFGVEDGTSCNYVTGISSLKSCSCLEEAVLSIAGSSQLDSSICTGSSIDLEVTLTGGLANGTFELHKDGNIFKPAFTNQSDGVVTIPVDESGNYTIQNFTGGCPGSVSGSVSITNKVAASIISQPNFTGVICEESSLNLSVGAVGENLSYQWKLDGADILSATNVTYNVTSVSKATDEGIYSVEIYGDCDTVLSNNVPVMINQTTGGITGFISGVNESCANATETFSVDPVSGSNVTYLWEVIPAISAVIGNTNSESITFEGATSYTIKVTPQGDCFNGRSNDTIVSITATVTPTVSLTQDITCEEETVIVRASSTGRGANPTYVWTTSATNNNSTSDTLELTNITNGTSVSVEMTSSSGCANPATANGDITISADPKPSTANIIETDQQICATSIVLNAGAITTGTGVWSMNQITGTNGSLSVTSGNSTTLNLDKTEVVEVTYTVSNGSCSPSAETVTIERVGDLSIPRYSIFEGNIPFSQIADAIVLCKDGSYRLEGATFDPATEEIRWSVSNTNVVIDDPTNRVTTISNLIVGSTEVTYTISSRLGECSQPYSLPLTILDKPSAVLQDILGDIEVCEKDIITYELPLPITSGEATEYVWILSNDTIEMTFLPEVAVDFTGITGDVSLSVVPKGYCGIGNASNLLAIDVEEYLIPMVTIQSDKTIVCVGKKIDLIASGTNIGISPTYSWSTGSTTNTSGATPVKGSNSYSLTVIPSTEMCNRTPVESPSIVVDGIEITIIDPTTFAPNPIERGADLTLSATVTPARNYIYDWTFDKENGELGEVISDSSVTQYTTSVEGKHNVSLTVTETSLGCSANRDLGEVTVFAPILIPNVFTPNGDGEGDVWDVSGMKSFESTVRIYNRWGNLIYDSFKYKNPWDGTYNGKPASVGTYFYIIEVTDELYEGPREIQGQIQILR